VARCGEARQPRLAAELGHRAARPRPAGRKIP
jgi:hypothetical protein